MRPLEVWGGVECTVNRVHGVWHNQLELSGHQQRLSDLDRIAELGIRTVRYPILWELTPAASGERRWDWAAERLERLRALGIRPIVGLVHHGSGPASTDLLDERFSWGLAEFAAELSLRFPWVDAYTPVNEPLTTARFSALYGHWHPHRRDDASFVRALLNQCRAVALAMQAIRRTCPGAQLIQTEDLGRTHSSVHMRYQRDFDNLRRWLTWDLLCGRVTAAHGLRTYLMENGASEHELDALCESPSPPQVIGINHYVTSDRYLDERAQRYPAHLRGGNAVEAYADVDAVRVLPGGYTGWQVITAAWERYKIPVALTEVHLGCTREDQLRWFDGAWSAACAARRLGCEVRAVTSWSLFGSYNWDSLLTRNSGSYECGAFDVRTPVPRPTAIAHMLRRRTQGESVQPLPGCGWWQRPSKILYRASGRRNLRLKPSAVQACPPPLLVCGAGRIGRAITAACIQRQLHVAGTDRRLELGNPVAVAEWLDRMQPWAVVNAAGFGAVGLAETEQQCIALAAHRRGIRFLTYSTDLVFDGLSTTPYLESSPTNPVDDHGRYMAAAERAVTRYPRTLCVRTAGLFDADEPVDSLGSALQRLAHGGAVEAFDDAILSPTYVPDLANASLDLLIDEATGIYHLSNGEALSWAGLIRRAAACIGIGAERLTPLRASNPQAGLRRARWSVLGSERSAIMPGIDSALARYAAAASPEPGLFLQGARPGTADTAGSPLP